MVSLFLGPLAFCSATPRGAHATNSGYDLEALQQLKVKESAGKKDALSTEYAFYKDKLKAAEAAAVNTANAAVQGDLDCEYI
jgi:hypothetical protein